MNMPVNMPVAPALSTRGPVLIVGTGLLGTSLALALSAARIEVQLADTSAHVAGPGPRYGSRASAHQWRRRTTHVVVATPPRCHAGVVLRELDAHPGAVVTDVASVKDSVAAEVRAHGGDSACRYVGSHPMAGRERSGAVAADSDLFVGRPWVIVGEWADPDSVLGSEISPLTWVPLRCS